MSPSSEPAVISAEVTVTLSANLHARPAGRLAQAAARFESTIEIEHAGRTVSPTGILSVMALGATLGSAITIRASGPDAERATRELAEVLADAE